MRKCVVIAGLLLTIITFVSFTNNPANNLRRVYSGSPAKWPSPFIDNGIEWKELGPLPGSPLEQHLDSLKHLIDLGKVLFFDPRLSGSGNISCATCHQPALSWTDGKERSLGHEGQVNKRNAPSIQNVWFYKKLFWDGRSHSLEDQSFAPINSESEMHGDMRELPFKLRQIKGYAELFKHAFGDAVINPDRIAEALATFQRTIISRGSAFDVFLAGKKNALNNSEIRGLHLFRTKARCMNCHNGPLFSDNEFHNNGFHLNGNPENDRGLYNVTHQELDIGKFKTPSLRDVMNTGPWMHNGQTKTMIDVIEHYNKGAEGNGGSDRLIKTIFLNNKEKADLLAFLNAISAPPLEFNKPVLPE
jgi:cytochrome c peroxidase